MRFSAEEVTEAVCGELVVPTGKTTPTIDGASIDSRSVSSTELFVPVVAERDGHDFVGAAVEAGVPLYLSARGDIRADAARIDVADTSAALMQLGAAARDRMTGPVIGITGSVGKTSVKDLTAAACGPSGTVHANVASFNNELGLPLTLVNAPDNVDITVVEMGSRGLGHIRRLCAPARPTIGVVTRVAAAHTELFGSVDQVAVAKGELIESLPASGTAVLNAGDPLVLAMASRTSASVLTFGATEAGAPLADVSAVDVSLDDFLRPSFMLRTPNGEISIALNVSGAHMAINAAAAAAAALAAGCTLEHIQEGLAGAQLSPMRMELLKAGSGATLINDAYNANPTSMTAALSALSRLRVRRKVAVLGVMGELGAGEVEAHEEIAASAVAHGIEIIAVDAPWYGTKATHVADSAEAAALIGDVDESVAILVKGSRVAALERLVELLQ